MPGNNLNSIHRSGLFEHDSTSVSGPYSTQTQVRNAPLNSQSTRFQPHKYLEHHDRKAEKHAIANIGRMSRIERETTNQSVKIGLPINRAIMVMLIKVNEKTDGASSEQAKLPS